MGAMRTADVAVGASVLTTTGAGKEVAGIVEIAVGALAVGGMLLSANGVLVGGGAGSFPQAAMNKSKVNKHRRDNRGECPILSFIIY